MPELPEVETIKEAIRKTVQDAKIESVVVYNRKFRTKVPDDFEKKVTGAIIKKIYRIAKYAICELDNNYSIIWHFGMSGKIKIIESNLNIIEKHDHIIINTSKGILIYNDTRRFGLMTYCKTDKLNEFHLFNKIGIDPFDSNLNTEYLLNKFINKKTAIKIALLDQSIINGIGNIYASEALYEARISPFRECHTLNYKEISSLIDAIQKILSNAIKAGGSTLRDYKKPDGSMGYFQNMHYVYNKAGTSCPYCACNKNKNNCIIKTTQAGRSTFYCKNIQK